MSDSKWHDGDDFTRWIMYHPEVVETVLDRMKPLLDALVPKKLPPIQGGSMRRCEET